MSGAGAAGPGLKARPQWGLPSGLQHSGQLNYVWLLMLNGMPSRQCSGHEAAQICQL